MRLLDALGLAPAVDTCVHCANALTGSGAWLDAEQGGFGCETCRLTWREVLWLDSDDMRNIRALAAAPGGAIAPTARARVRASQAIEALVNHHLGRRPKAGVHALEFVRGS
jgi:recombinational DNA repair protein (RecF pathway)